MAQKFANNFITTLTGNILSTDLSLPLTTVAGLPALAAGDYIYGALVNNSNQVEFFIATAIAGSNLTIPAGGRGIGGSTARNYSTGDTVRAVLIRESLLQIQQEAAASVATAGTDVYTAGYTPALRGYINGVEYYIHFGNTNTSTVPTLNLNGLGAINVTLQGGGVLAPGDIPLEAILRYDGVNMVLLNPARSITVVNPANIDQVLVDAATIAWDMSKGGIATVTLGAAGRTMGLPTNLKKGTYILNVYQDGTGNRTINPWNAVFKWSGGIAPVLSTGINKRDIITLVCDGATLAGAAILDVR
jgi:hypothetical protein